MAQSATATANANVMRYQAGMTEEGGWLSALADGIGAYASSSAKAPPGSSQDGPYTVRDTYSGGGANNEYASMIYGEYGN